MVVEADTFDSLQQVRIEKMPVKDGELAMKEANRELKVGRSGYPPVFNSENILAPLCTLNVYAEVLFNEKFHYKKN